MVTEANDDFHYDNPGKGYLFIPSGLGYRNSSQGAITANSPLVFKIALHDVNLVDSDLDGVPSKYEYTVEENGKITVVDTDGDGFNDYLDRDDDGDGILTRTEVVKEYGDNGDIEFVYKYSDPDTELLPIEILGTEFEEIDGEYVRKIPIYKDNDLTR